MRTPDEIEPRHAWRVFWALQPRNHYTETSPMNEIWLPNRDSWELQSLNHGMRWSKTNIATCTTGHEAPDANCMCGLWSTKDLTTLQRCVGGATSDKRRVICLGKVRIWGKVIEHEHGYRSSHADIQELWMLYHVPYGRGSGSGSYGFVVSNQPPTIPDSWQHIAKGLQTLYRCPVSLSHWNQVRDESGETEQEPTAIDITTSASPGWGTVATLTLGSYATQSVGVATTWDPDEDRGWWERHLRQMLIVAVALNLIAFACNLALIIGKAAQ